MMNLLLTDKRDVTDNDLNHYYGQYGKTFKTREEAIDFGNTIEKRGAKYYISRIMNYRDNDVRTVDGSGTHNEGATPFCKGYLVTIIAEQWK